MVLGLKTNAMKNMNMNIYEKVSIKSKHEKVITITQTDCKEWKIILERLHIIILPQKLLKTT